MKTNQNNGDGGARASAKIPDAVRRYADRIHAEVRNFRRLVILAHDRGYPTERVVIRIDAEGAVNCPKEYAPTTEEAEAIRAAAAGFPKSGPIALRGAREQVPLISGRADSVFYFVTDRQDGDMVLMVQERALINGQKVYLPWTPFSDGGWWQLEPDGPLPFWKPHRKSRAGRLMVHEGAKAAAAADAIAADPESKHPWAPLLRLHDHWGMLGGARAAHRVDYDEIRRAQPVAVVYVADNDYPGKSALAVFSRHYAKALSGVFFDASFSESWDIADEIPPEMFTAGRFRGPPLHSLMRPATWATEPIYAGERGRPAYRLREDFVREWVHSVIPDAYIHGENPSLILNKDQFNDRVRPFSHLDNTARLIKGDEAIKSVTLEYRPGIAPGIHAADGKPFFNTFVPTQIEPEEGDVGPWIEFMERLIPGTEDRRQTLRWCATLIARPEVRMAYGVLLISETQGVGKGTLGEKVLAPLVGMSNVSFPSETEVVDSAYNYWLSHKRLAVVHEIYAGHSAKAYNKLKSVITDRYVTVLRKYLANYEVENWVHIIACSNSRRAIQLTLQDRRWFVPTVTEALEKSAYWTKFNKWLGEEGLGIILHWAGEYLNTEEPVAAGVAPPGSQRKREMIEDSYSPGMELVAAFLNKAREEYSDQHLLIVDTDLVRLIRRCLYHDRPSDKLEKSLTVRNVAKGAGWHVSPHLLPMARHTKWSDGTPTNKGRALLSHAEDAGREPDALAAEIKAGRLTVLRAETTAGKWGFLQM